MAFAPLIAAEEERFVGDVAERVVDALELVAVVIVAGGVVLAGLRYVLNRARHGRAYEGFRHDIARAILVTLEVLVAADIVFTVVVERTFEQVGSLAILVVTRVILSWSLIVEIDGYWPWERWRVQRDAPELADDL